MTRRLLALAIAVHLAVVAAAVVVAGRDRAPGDGDPAPGPAAPPPAPAEGAPVAFRIAYDDPHAAAASAARYGAVILNPDQVDAAARIKADSPTTLVFAYKCLSSARDLPGLHDAGTGTDGEALPTGVGYAEASAHPDWFLTGPDGARLEWPAWPGHWHLDVGNRAYQRRWVANVTAELAGGPWDGVFLDNATWRATAYVDPPPAAYPTDDAMAAAMRSMLEVVGPALRDAGLLSVANIAESRRRPGLWADWLGFVDGAMEEHFATSRTEPTGDHVWSWGADGWRAVVDQVAAAERSGKLALLRVGGLPADRQAFRYGLGTYLLANEGGAMIAPPELVDPPWHPELDWNLGAARGPARPVGGDPGVLRRDFDAGTVVVNATRSAPVAVELGRAMVDGDGTPVRSVTVAPMQAAILRTPG